MPYIHPLARAVLANGTKPSSVGELNYVVSTLMNEHLAKYGCSYSSINELIGVLECAKLELYRRIAAPYEDEKKVANGDVFTI